MNGLYRSSTSLLQITGQSASLAHTGIGLRVGDGVGKEGLSVGTVVGKEVVGKEVGLIVSPALEGVVPILYKRVL